MELEQIRTVIKCACAAASLLVFFLIITISLRFHPGQAAVKIYDRINSRLKERKKSRLFNYEKIQKFLLANGAEQHYGRRMEPIKFIAVKSIAAAGVFCVLLRLHWIMAAAGILIGYQIPDMLLAYLNKQDNFKMLPQIQTMYSTLTVQIKAGVYVTDALSECYRGLPKGRIRKALEELSGELYMKSTFDEAVNHFNGKFSNAFIDSLCIILLQAQESGQAVQLLSDITEQVKDMQSALLIRKKEQLDRRSTFCILGIVAAALAVIMYACIMSVLSAAGGL